MGYETQSATHHIDRPVLPPTPPRAERPKSAATPIAISTNALTCNR